MENHGEPWRTSYDGLRHAVGLTFVISDHPLASINQSFKRPVGACKVSMEEKLDHAGPAIAAKDTETHVQELSEDASRPPIDRGRDAWGVILASFIYEGLQWGRTPSVFAL